MIFHPDWGDYVKSYPLRNDFLLKQKIAIQLGTRGCHIHALITAYPYNKEERSEQEISQK